MDIRLKDESDESGTVAITFGEDDPFTLGGYGSRGGVTLELPLYRNEARELIEVLEPIADPDRTLLPEERLAVLTFIESVLTGTSDVAVHDALAPAQCDAFASARAKLAAEPATPNEG